MRYLTVAFLLVIAVMCAAFYLISQQKNVSDLGVWAIAQQLDRPASDNAATVRFPIRKGETASTIATRLETSRLISNAWLFRVVARLRGVENRLEAGEYLLRRNMTVNEIIDELQGGRYLGSMITVIEGWRMEEIADLLHKRKVVDRAEFLRLANSAFFDAEFLRSRPPNSSLDGYLFPDTYRVPPGITASDLITTMLKNFGEHFDGPMREQATKRGLTIHQVATLASIVEREAAVAGERSIIASVYLNRLKRNMPLQADPTVQYAVAAARLGQVDENGYWKKSLTTADLAFDSPYNTYRYRGLPPGPIANPGLASLKSALEPAETDFLYFVARDDGSHAFARTLQEHDSNVSKYQK
ncbi:MAG: endolytic transglycosylase MltG [Chloroflexi bacterium]|nr:endolytic transglycosylase MltG [Chloroflexota bacterium]